MSIKESLRCRHLLAMLAAVVAGCGGGGDTNSVSGTPTTPTTPTAVLTTISVSIAPPMLQTGQTGTATATGVDQNGSTIALGAITWASSNPGVATINQAGAINAVGAGTTQITASAGGKIGTTALTVIVTPTVASVTISLSATTAAQGQKATATATANDQNGTPVPVRVTWSSSNTTVATIDSAGTITALAPGTTTIVGRVDGHQGEATFTVTTVPVAAVSVSPASATLTIGATQQFTATTRDAAGNTLTGRQITWSSSDPTKATVTTTGLVQAIAAGTATIVATSETKAGSAAVTVAATTPPPACTPSSATKLAVGDIRTLTPVEVASLCLGGLAAGSEYVLIPFNRSSVASSTTQIELAATGTVAVTASPNRIPVSSPSGSLSSALRDVSLEGAFRGRERRDIGSLRARGGALRSITGVPANPTVGSTAQLNASLNGNTCSDPKILHTARVVTVTPHTIVFIDAQSPAGGYTDAELIAFATTFDTLGFALDTLNFGAPTDIDSNGRLGIFFTPGVNQIPQPAGGVIGGLFAARDLFTANTQGCVGSNEGEMFYMPVPDPNKTINGNYATKSAVAGLVNGTLVHEFQHLINASRRIYVNNADALEQVWLNEGLSHIAEELLYYRQSGNAPLQNINVTRVTSSQIQVDAFNNDQSQNFGRLSTYLAAPTQNSPYGLIDGLEMRGAIWQLLRYSADLKGGTQRDTWRALVNSATNGQANYNAVFGDIVTNTRNWAVAQFTDDAGFTVPAEYTHPSWNYRSVFTGLSIRKFPLATYALVPNANIQLTVVGGGAGYVRFGVATGVAANVAATSQGQSVPPTIDFILVRTQ